MDLLLRLFHDIELFAQLTKSNWQLNAYMVDAYIQDTFKMLRLAHHIGVLMDLHKMLCFWCVYSKYVFVIDMSIKPSKEGTARIYRFFCVTRAIFRESK